MQVALEFNQRSRLDGDYPVGTVRYEVGGARTLVAERCKTRRMQWVRAWMRQQAQEIRRGLFERNFER